MPLRNFCLNYNIVLPNTVRKICFLVYVFLPTIVGESINSVPKDPDPKELGTFGEVFSIQERNLIEVIQAKLLKLQGEGKLEEYNQQVQKKVKNQIERPTPVKGIVHTKTPRTFTFDPSITVTNDLKDTHGVVFHHRGDRINPLKMRPMTKPLLFIDGDAPLHLTWGLMMLKTYPLAKIILVNGPPLQIMKDLGMPVYFDQFGRITKKLGITQVPAIVSQDGDVLKIEEVNVDAEDLVDLRYKNQLSDKQQDKKAV